MSYSVIRTDLMSGTKQPADMVSLRFYEATTADGKTTYVAKDVENGVIAKLLGYEDGEREIYRAVAATASDNLNDCVVIATPEVMYDERKRNLDEFINEAGTIARGYILRARNVFSLTSAGFDGTAPKKGDDVVIGTGGKLKKAAANATSTFGVCADVEKAGRYEYHAIRIGKVEA